MNKLKLTFALMAFIFVAGCSSSSENSNKAAENLAMAWVKAANSSKSEAMEMVTKNMAEDGEVLGDRYVGMGFIWNPDEDGMTVTYIIPDSPASKALEVGDSFVEVQGVRLTSENRNSLGFRGKPGEEVSGVVLRDGREVAISVARGAVRQVSSKSQVLENMEQGDAMDWGPDKFEVREVSSTDEGTVWVLSWSEFTEEASGLTSNAWTATRFEFDEDGKVNWVANLSEDRFVLEQQGYSITR
tara:strand:- start:21 stop:749 length:729 start_codon:yes stop_codon:yes gene_type:complete